MPCFERSLPLNRQSNLSLTARDVKIKVDDCVKISPCVLTCGDSVLGTPHRLFYVPSAAFRPHPWHGLRTENLHGAKETPTAKKGRETPVRGGKHGQWRKRRSVAEKTVRGGKDGQGRNKTGEETTATKLPAHAADTRPALWPLSLSME